MKMLTKDRMATIAVGVTGLAFLAMPVCAQEAGSVQELQRVIEHQQRQLEAQQKQLDAQQQLLQELQSKIQSLAREPVRDQPAVAAEMPPEKPPAETVKARPPKYEGLSQAEKHDRESPTGSNVTYYDPAKKINIPGSKTSIGLHGLAEFQIIHDSVGLNNNRFDTATIPVDGGPSQTKFSVNPSQIQLSSTTPVPEGQLNTMISMDFNGQIDTPDPRLRIAYGEFVNDEVGYGVLAGQAYGTMLDLRAVPETLDFAGPASLWQLRTPLLRYTRAVGERMVAELAVESPENANYIDASRLTRWPDLVVAGTWLIGDEYLKHFRFAGIARDLGAEHDNGSRDSALGWAVTGSAKLGLPFMGAKDNLRFAVQYGDGYGTQLKGGPREGAFNVATSELETIGIFGSFGGIQHFWSDQLRSNLVYGYVDSDNPAFLDGDAFDNTQYVAADLIWAPYDTTTFGVEYLWGRRENKDGTNGDSNRLLFSSRFDF